MNPRYLFTILGRSTNLLCPFDVERGKVWDSQRYEWADGNGNATDYIPIESGGYQLISKNGTQLDGYAVVYNSNKTPIAETRMAYGTYYPFTTLWSQAAFIRVQLSTALEPEDFYIGQEETFDSWFNNVFNPLWKDDLTMEFAKESQQEFFRRKLSGKLTFINDDYTYIKSKSLDYQFQMRMMISYDNGENWADYWKGHFYWTDCEFDEDSKYIRVTPTVDDEYNDILAGLEKEYNMIDLAPAYEEINIKKRPVIQIIPFKGDGGYSKAGCFKVDGTYWERDCNQVTWGGPIVPLMSQRYYFNIASGIIEMTISPQGQVPDGFPTYIKDMFVGHLYGTSHGYKEYSLRYSFVLQSGQWRIEITFENPQVTITNVSTGVVTWKSDVGSGVGNITLVSQVSNYDNLTAVVDNPYNLFSRLVFDEEGVSGAANIPANDIMATNENYRYCLQNFDVTHNVYFTDEYSTTPTKWGKHDPTHYFISPPTTTVRGWSPIAITIWEDIALWFGYTADLLPVEPATMADATLKHAYKISDVIGVLLKKVAPNITLAQNSFLNGTDPITGDARTFFLTPKTNVKKIDYEIPAMNAPITLKQIFDMLRDGYKCYWYIENNQLHIEHIAFFLNGHNYDPSSLTYQIDLTAQTVSRNGKAWAFALNKYTFDKPELTERYEFGWMDDETLPFNGEPINIESGFVEQGKVEKIDISQFSSDVDFILMNPEDIADDGFVLLGAVYSGGEWSLAFKEFSDMDFVRLQNAYCAFVYMQKYYMYDLPSYRYRIGDGITQTNATMKKCKSQEVSFPCITDPDIQKLIKTSIGNGQIEKLSINLSSRNGKATLKYEP